jgi:hypothetical protein
MSNPPTLSLAVSGSAPGQTTSTEALAVAVNAVAAALHTTAVAAGARISAKAFTASVVGNDWTVTWSGALGVLADDNVTVDDVTALSVASGSAAWCLPTGGAVTVSANDAGLRDDFESGAKIPLLVNRSGAVTGLLAIGWAATRAILGKIL